MAPFRSSLSCGQAAVLEQNLFQWRLKSNLFSYFHGLCVAVAVAVVAAFLSYVLYESESVRACVMVCLFLKE